MSADRNGDAAKNPLDFAPGCAVINVFEIGEREFLNTIPLERRIVNIGEERQEAQRGACFVVRSPLSRGRHVIRTMPRMRNKSAGLRAAVREYRCKRKVVCQQWVMLRMFSGSLP